jgi:putative endopeptidase
MRQGFRECLMNGCKSAAALCGSPLLLLVAAALAAPPVGEVGIDLAGIDKTVKPGNDFFSFANGTWVKSTEIPADRSSWGSNQILSEKTDQQVADLIRKAANDPKSTAEAEKIGAYYNSFMDEAGIESKGLTPARPGMAEISAISDKKTLASALGGTLRADVDVLNNTRLQTDNLFGLWVAADLDHPTSYAPFLLQGGLSLPDREYYLATSPSMAAIRDAFKTHIAKVLTMAGVRDSTRKTQNIYILETAIAKAHWTRADSENVVKANNHWTRADFDTKAPGLDWAAYFAAAGLSTQKAYILWQPSAVSGEAALVANTPLETWKDYLTFHYIDRNSGVLPKPFVEEHFAFYGKVLSGTPLLEARWKRAVAATNSALGEAVGKLYVAKYFPPKDKAAVQVLVKNLIAAFGKRIDRLDWMSPATKEKAKAKLASLKVGVGYPDRWRDYTGFVALKGDAFGNAQRASQFDTREKLAKLGREVDRGEWVMNPQLVNAVNLPVLNALNFPAAELQAPHFDEKAAAAVNYGAIGTIIGHEISHSFDDQGAMFDASGQLKNWWTDADFAHFQASSAQLARQFDGYRPFPDMAVNGKQTLSENIADVAGLSVAYDGYRISLGGTSPAPVDGLSGDQLFFLAFGQVWRNKTREAALRQQLLTDGHAPARYRAQTVRNIDAWYSAFDGKPGEALYLSPKDRVKIW